MSSYQIAKVLIIAGVFLATIFGGILLNREVVGEWADRFNLKFLNFKDRLTTQYIAIAEPIVSSKLLEKMAPTIIVTFGVVGTIVGWLNDISWLFWVGVILICPYILATAIQTFIWHWNIRRAFPIWLFPVFLLFRFLLAFLVGPILIVPFWLLMFVFGIITIILNAVAGKDIIKRGLIILGSLLILIGLILETIITW